MFGTRFLVLVVVGLLVGTACADDSMTAGTDVTGQDVSVDVPVSVTGLVINELAAAGDPNDWIELYNGGSDSLDLGGWTLTDSDPLHTHVFAGGQTIGAGGYKLLLRQEAGGFTFGLGAMDSVVLYDGFGVVVDRVDWAEGASPAQTSYGRIPNGEGDFQTLVGPTPAAENVENPSWSCGDGVKNLDEICDGSDLAGGHCEHYGLTGAGLACAQDCQSYDTTGCKELTRAVVINEVSSSNDDPIELFNPGADPVDLSGWTVSDENDDPVLGVYVFPDATILEAGAYHVMRKDVEHLFGLGGADSVRLRDPAGLLVDSVMWPKDGALVSFCRVPNGTGAAQVCSTATLEGTNAP